jgi:hypothetical protein
MRVARNARSGGSEMNPFGSPLGGLDILWRGKPNESGMSQWRVRCRGCLKVYMITGVRWCVERRSGCLSCAAKRRERRRRDAERDEWSRNVLSLALLFPRDDRIA